MRWPVPGEQVATTQLQQEADIRRGRQQRAQRRRRSRWGWLTDPNNFWLVLAGAAAAGIVAGALG